MSELIRSFLDGEKLREGGRYSLQVLDQGLMEFILCSFASSLSDQLRQKQNLVILGEPWKDLLALEAILERTSRLQSKQLHLMPVVSYWGMDRFANQASSAQQRLKALYHLNHSPSSQVLISSPRAMAQTVLDPKLLDSVMLRLECEQLYDPDELVAALTDLGYLEADLVTEPGTYTQRGGILDIFASQSEFPFRLEFFGDELASIRLFDPETQRSKKELAVAEVYVAMEALVLNSERRQNLQKFYDALMAQDMDRHERQGLLDAFEKAYRPTGFGMFHPLFRQKQSLSSLQTLGDRDWVVTTRSVSDLLADYRQFFEQICDQHKSDLEERKPLLDPIKHFLSPEALAEQFSRIPNLLELKSSVGSEPEWVSPVKGRSQLEPRVRQMLNQLADSNIDRLKDDVLRSGIGVIVVVHEFEQGKRLAQILEAHELLLKLHDEPLLDILREPRQLDQETIHICRGYLSEWTYLEDRQLVLIPDFLFYGAKAAKKPRIRSQRQIQALLSSFRDLSTGSAVVHVEHGIGRYQGIQTLEVSGVKNDFLIIEYAGQDKIYVPVDRLNLVQKYAAGEGSDTPPLDRLKSQAWVRRKGKVKKAVQDLAEQLLKIQARRRMAHRSRFSEPGELYFQFEADFAFDETDDQLQVIEEVNQDLSREEPMDRLVCGDVGFGKTEIALRAAMRVVVDGSQVMVLAPTTVLSFQHFKTFKQRFDKYGVSVALLNRFVSAKLVSDVKEAFKTGKLDILIGTHRLLSKDIKPRNLGMIVVDEEQRFGVAHKEAIKDLKAGCDILTLTATPIPRSLHMSMLGLRDISVIMTPPGERLAIKTYVAKFDADLIRKGVERELKRGGQVFFVHNRVDNILTIRKFLAELLSGVEVRVGHGQMREHELEKVMVDFIDQKFPVLLCTTIIESGLDIPNVNTIFVNQAENFGLAQLYQMRGRVGRSSRQSYAYFLTQKSDAISDDAHRRLEILAAHQDLGSGFQIANYDLEMRGAGNLLGGEQSGHVKEVGLELYTTMLHEEIMRMRGQVDSRSVVETEIKIPLSATIPHNYVQSENQRLMIYKTLFSADQVEEVHKLADEVKDRYGPLPELCQSIFLIAEIKILLSAIRASSINLAAEGVFEVKFHSLTESEIATITEVIGRNDSRYQLKPDFSLLIFANDGSTQFSGNTMLERLISLIQALSFPMLKAKE